MAEYDMRSIEVDCPVQDTYELLRKYFLRENNPFKVLSDYNGEDGFTIDIVRSYSFVASTFKANIHLAGHPLDDGRTIVKFHAKSNEEPAKLEKEVVDRIEETLGYMVAEFKDTPKPEFEITEEEKKKNRVELIVVIVVAALIVLGAVPISCSDSFSKFWMF